MKKVLSFVILFSLIFLFAGCDSNTTGTSDLDTETSSVIDTATEYTIDYKDAKSFEAALNNGENVNGKIVRFDVIEYKPNSEIGINCWSGEHLNFISENELDVEKGDIIIGRITKEPSKTFGSWKVPYEVLRIEGKELDTETETNSKNTETKPTHAHLFETANCTIPAKCSCGATSGNALGHSFNQGKCSRCGASDPDYDPVSLSKQNALKKAKSYLDFSAFSRQGLIGQLEYEKFSHEEAVYGVDNCGANWNEQALKKAKSYLDFSAFSRQGLIDQLEYEEFTTEQAKYGVDNCGANWNEQAAKKAKSYLDFSAFSRQGLIEQLEYEGFTHEQAVYGVDSVGL